MKNMLGLTELNKREMARIFGGKSNQPSGCGCGCGCDDADQKNNVNNTALEHAGESVQQMR